jgi:two-component system chemotaxis sensor kinase CheA
VPNEALTLRLRAMFVDELDDLVREANESLLALERTPEDSEHLRSLFRVMHTVKGAARAAGVLPAERLCHVLEAQLAAARDGGRPLSRAELDALFAGVDRLAAAQATMRAGGVMADTDAAIPSGRPANAATAAPSPARPSGSEPTAPPGRADATVAPRQEPVPEGAIRVGQDRVDSLVAIANRLLILAGRIEAQPAEIEELHDVSVRASAAWKRVRRPLAAALAAQGNAGARDLEAIDDAMGLLRKTSSHMLGESLQSARALGRLASEVSQGVRELRMRPFADALADVPRVVRDIATATGKQVALQTSGETVQADRAVLKQLHDALIHLVRNAVDHGIESPEARSASGKPVQGTIRVGASLIGDRIAVVVHDDGAGLDIATMRRRLAERGEVVPADDRAVARRLFLGGMSTRETTTSISGRGVGLDAVHAVAERVRGSVEVDWTPGGGTTFTLEAPLTLATVRAVLSRVGATRIAIPAAFVERLLRSDPDTLRSVEGRRVVGTSGAPVPVASLAAILGPPIIDRPPDGVWSLVMLRVGDRRVAVRVDELLDELEVVVRPIRAYGRVAVPHVSGAAMLASGTVALVLNVMAVVTTALGLPAEMAAANTPRTAAARRRRVLVVDDSITTRTLESSVLEAAGYDVTTAVDGADGWRLLQERGADLVVSDVEMPRMDGLQLCESIRASARFRELPVILVTALETPEHRARGLEVGADAYLGKSSFEQESLLTTVRDLLG